MTQPIKSVVIGTAGHIDHGKTALVRALTGIDADRLPEEKRRGITIDLGFAFLEVGSSSGRPLQNQLLSMSPDTACLFTTCLPGPGALARSCW